MMGRQIGSFNRSSYYPFNFQRQLSRISVSDLTSSPLPTLSTNSPSTDRDDSTQTIFNTTSDFSNPDEETHDKVLDSEPSPSTFSEPPFQPLTSQLPNESCPVRSPYNDATPILSPMTIDQPNPPSPMTDNQLDLESDNFIIQQQHIHNTNTLSIHHLTHSNSSSESSIQTVNAQPTRAHRVFKRKHPNTTPNS